LKCPCGGCSWPDWSGREVTCPRCGRLYHNWGVDGTWEWLPHPSAVQAEHILKTVLPQMDAIGAVLARMESRLTALQKAMAPAKPKKKTKP